ncbi:MAG: hypothetical protein KatS3mg077_0015 [Candidatus Binatia bacterium]|nr:MAG: hypothetical protein KatS3mg077_0015 [Candidatus Binatia bacterium]
MLTCRELTELVTDYLEGRMPLVQRLKFHMHLGMCRHCRAYLRQMRLTIRTLGALPPEPMPENIRQELLLRFRQMRPKSHAAAVPPSLPVRVFLWTQRTAGGPRGWAAVALLLIAVFAALAAKGLEPGPLGNGLHCLVAELIGAGTAVALLVALARAAHSQAEHSLFAVFATAGAAAGFAVLELTCELSHTAAHALLFHFGGVLLAALAAVAASRLTTSQQSA